MPCFRVTFFKEVTTDDGHDVETRQAAFDVNAVDEKQAAMLAQQRFCGDRNLTHWQVNADRCDVESQDAGEQPGDVGWVVRPAME